MGVAASGSGTGLRQYTDVNTYTQKNTYTLQGIKVGIGLYNLTK